MADILVRAALGRARPHREQRLCAIERLNLTLLVDAEHERLAFSIHVQPDDVAHLLDEPRVGRELERPGAVRLEVERTPDARHRRLAQAELFGERARAPVRRVLGLGLERTRHDHVHASVVDRPRPSGARLVVEPFEPALGEALSPRLHGRTADAELGADLRVVEPVGRGEHDARPRREGLGGLPPPRPTLELVPLVLGQFDRDRRRSRHADALRDWLSQDIGAPARARLLPTRDTSVRCPKRPAPGWEANRKVFRCPRTHVYTHRGLSLTDRSMNARLVQCDQDLPNSSIPPARPGPLVMCSGAAATTARG